MLTAREEGGGGSSGHPLARTPATSPVLDSIIFVFIVSIGVTATTASIVPAPCARSVSSSPTPPTRVQSHSVNVGGTHHAGEKLARHRQLSALVREQALAIRVSSETDARLWDSPNL